MSEQNSLKRHAEVTHDVAKRSKLSDSEEVIVINDEISSKKEDGLSDTLVSASNVERNSCKSEQIVESNALKSERIVTNEVHIGKKYIDVLSALPDDVLMVIFSFMDPLELLNLSLCNTRLSKICKDKRLWLDVTLDCSGACSSHKPFMRFLGHVRRLHLEDSDLVNLQGADPFACLPSNFLSFLKVRMPFLVEFELHGHMINFELFDLNTFPSTIEVLSFQGCGASNVPADPERSPFYRISLLLPKLRSLNLSYCHWFDPQSLLPLAKCEHLEELNLQGCGNAHSFIPYASIATNCGFKALKSLDLRFTGVGDMEVACFERMKTLEELYLENPDHLLQHANGPHHHANTITDHFITTFGEFQHDAQGGEEFAPYRIYVYPIGEGADPSVFKNTTLKKAVVRGYPLVTDLSLRSAAANFKSLRYLDVSETGCTPEGAAQFKARRPEVTLIFNNAEVPYNVLA